MRTLIVCVVALLLAAPVFAQGLAVNPTKVVFVASADHALNGLDGQPLVDHYELRMFLEGGAQPVQVQPLGKPTPDGENTITVENAAWFAAGALTPNVRHVAKVAAVGPTGEGVSENSNPFGTTAPPAPPAQPPAIR